MRVRLTAGELDIEFHRFFAAATLQEGLLELLREGEVERAVRRSLEDTEGILVKHLKGISDSDIVKLNIPTATPYVFEFDDNLNLVRDYYLADPEELAAKQAAVANQGKAK